MHWLVYLHHKSRVDFERFRTNVPTGNLRLLSPSSNFRSRTSLLLCFTFTMNPCQPTLIWQCIVQHNADALDTLSPKCSMDVQITDGSDMLMWYIFLVLVSEWSYLSDSAALFTRGLNAHQATFRYLRNLRLCKAEMYTTLASFKVAWSSRRTKCYTLRNLDNAANRKTYEKYLQCPIVDEHLTFLQCRCVYVDSPAQPKRYTSVTCWWVSNISL